MKKYVIETFLTTGKKFEINCNEKEFFEKLELDAETYAGMTLDDTIDDENEKIMIGTFEFFPSAVLKEIDPTAYRCYMDDYQDSIYIGFKDDLEKDNKCTIDYEEIGSLCSKVIYKIEEINL